MDKLTARQEAFVLYYLAGDDGVRGNATRSAIAAGYSARSATTIGGRLLQSPPVAIRISGMREEAEQKAGAQLVEWMELAPMAQNQLLLVALGKVHHRLAMAAVKAAIHVLDRALGKVRQDVRISGELTIEALLAETDKDDAPDVAFAADLDGYPRRLAGPALRSRIP